jgi:hypothetical protein
MPNQFHLEFLKKKNEKFNQPLYSFLVRHFAWRLEQRWSVNAKCKLKDYLYALSPDYPTHRALPHYTALPHGPVTAKEQLWFLARNL